MNVFKALYCNQYYELEPKGKADMAKKIGTILLTIALVILLLALFFLLIAFFPDVERDLDKCFKRTFGNSNGKFIGRFVGLLLFAGVYPLIRYTIGKESNYQNIITEFNTKSKTEKANISRKGLWFFISAIVFLVISLIAVMVKINFMD